MAKGTPLRQWASASYSSSTGRAASGLLSEGSITTCDGELLKGNQQIPKDRGRGGAPGFDEFTKNHTQGGS
jgi:hypothetical protein